MGAGASQAAGLYNAKELANYLFKEAGNIVAIEEFKDDLTRLVAVLDNDSNYTRKWVNIKMNEYFTNYKNYKSLDTHKKLLSNQWAAIFTTNYDMCMEYAENDLKSKPYRLLPIVNPKEEVALYNRHEGKLKYFKIHGCCHELMIHPSTSCPLVITQSDFRQSIARNKPFFEELKRYAYSGSIVFIGFRVHRAENNPILANIIDTYTNLMSSFHEPFKAFVVLRDVNNVEKLDIKDAGLNLIEGTFEDFVDSVIDLRKCNEIKSETKPIDEKIWVKSEKNEVEFTIGELKQFSSQFIFYYEGYLEEKSSINISKNELIDIWKSKPSDILRSRGYYFNRSCFNAAKEKLNDAISKAISSKNSQLLIITGKRASGKSVLARQLIASAYSDLHLPSIVLTPDANYIENVKMLEEQVSISGWDSRLIDKFLSRFDDESDNLQHEIVPVILADHLIHRVNALDHLLDYLENHNKPCIMILTLNQDEYEKLKMPECGDRLLQLYKYHEISIPHKLDDQEIDDMFGVVSKLEPRVQDKKSDLIAKAKYNSWGNRDILIILYTWFDKQFRRFEEIVADEIEKLNESTKIKSFYLAVSVFHQYNYSPPIYICAMSAGINLDDFSNIRSLPLFKTMINIDRNITESGREVASTRHSAFSKIVLQKLMPAADDKINLMCNVLSLCGQSELQFVRDFFIYICRHEASLSIEQVTRIKEATEKKLSEDYLLNHQFGAYLIREGANLNNARYYLDLANEKSPFNSSILHSIGNLCYKQFKEKINEDKNQSLKYYETAQKYFSQCRAQANSREEHAYYTEISMINYRLNHFPDNENTKVLLRAEKNALIKEALNVVPSERQNLLKESVSEVPFDNLLLNEKQIIIAQIMDGKASHLIIEYYANSLLQFPSTDNWQKLNNIVKIYWESSKDDISKAIILCEIAKHAFIKNAITRFEFMRTFYKDLVRYQNDKINFVLMARYVRLIQIDALVLEKYDFLRDISEDIINLFRDSKPAFLEDEFILEQAYYCFDENNYVKQMDIFMHSNNLFTIKNARRYQELVYLDDREGTKKFKIELDPISHYFIRGIRKEVTIKGKVELSFAIKHRHDGFWATDFRT